MSAHDPGPWRLGHCNAGLRCVWTVGEQPRRGGLGLSSNWIDCNTPGNARLVAAAPDLLAALEALLSEVTEELGWKSEDQARAAIAKARGDAPAAKPEAADINGLDIKLMRIAQGCARESCSAEWLAPPAWVMQAMEQAYAMGADRRKSSEPAAQPEAPERTVRVRIAVAVDGDGNWAAAGLPPGARYVVHWVEADVPVPHWTVPEARTARGEVTP